MLSETRRTDDALIEDACVVGYASIPMQKVR